MAKKNTTFCIACGAVVSPHIRFCSRLCKLIGKPKKAKPRKHSKHKSNKAKHITAGKKAK